MLASNTKGVSRYFAGRTGRKCSNTFSAMERVSRVFKSQAYSPDQRNVFPLTRWTPAVSMSRDFQNSNSLSGKSFPTIPTRFIAVKKLAPNAAYEAEPPSKSECSSTGVFTVSSPMEPTTRRDIIRAQSSVVNYLAAFCSRQHVRGAARVINDAVRFEQGGNHDHAIRAGIDDSL